MLVNHTGACATTPTPEEFTLEDFERVGVRIVERCFKAKDVIFAPGDPDDQLYFLLKGTVRLYKFYGDYKEATTALLGDGGVFGKLSLMESRWQDVFAEAVTNDVRVANVHKATLTEIVRRDPGFALKLFSSFSEMLFRPFSARSSLISVSALTAGCLTASRSRAGVRSWPEQNGPLPIRLQQLGTEDYLAILDLYRPLSLKLAHHLRYRLPGRSYHVRQVLVRQAHP